MTSIKILNITIKKNIEYFSFSSEQKFYNNYYYVINKINNNNTNLKCRIWQGLGSHKNLKGTYHGRLDPKCLKKKLKKNDNLYILQNNKITKDIVINKNIIINKWYGRLGNNIMQLIKVIQIGLYYNWNIIIPKHNFFNKKYIIINKNIKNNKKFKLCTSPKDFFIIDYKIFDKQIFNKNIKQTISILKDLFIIKEYYKFNKDDLLIHIRSGDQFSNNKGKIHRNYIQPPLDYYKNILNNNNFNNIFIISEDYKNPITNKLLELYPKINFKVQTLKEDIKLILGAKNIIDSYGTFIPSLIIFSDNIKNIYKVNYQQNSFLCKNKEIKVNVLDYSKYQSKIGNWTCSNTQIKLMLTYKKN